MTDATKRAGWLGVVCNSLTKSWWYAYRECWRSETRDEG